MNEQLPSQLSAVNVVWLKRDLRLADHVPLTNAINTGTTLLYYAFEPLLVNDPHYAIRHWRFVLQSLQDMNQQLEAFNAQIYIYYGHAIDGLIAIHNHLSIQGLFSHEETGLLATFERDKAIKAWCKAQQILWQESQSGGVTRGKKNRVNWDKNWTAAIKAPLDTPRLFNENLLHKDALLALPCTQLPDAWYEDDPHMLNGGERWALKILHSFLKDRGKQYTKNISKPAESRTSCSRLSPYLAWGNISLRQVYQAALLKRSETGWQRAIDGFASRLHWHCHFIQKFESEHQLQWRPVNRAYFAFNYPETHCDLDIETRLNKWKQAQTGYPLVDACMLCLIKTGYINFRMRAMLVSFLCHHLLVDWRLGAAHLASLFLDFEPGIHYPQMQMQSGVTGTNVIRVYNPIKQSIEKDKTAHFIKKWLPQLTPLPKEIAHTPWLLTPMEEQLYQFTVGEDYPHPIVDIEQTGSIARDLLWGFQKRDDTKKEGVRIVARHVRQPARRKKKAKKVTSTPGNKHA